jgi:hypothetical protein
MSERGDYQEWSRLARLISGMVFLQLLLMIRSFGRPLSQLLAWTKQPCAWARELLLERGTLLCLIAKHSPGKLFRRNMARLKSKIQKVGGTIMSKGVTDKSTGLPLFSELAWFAYKVSGVMCSASACEHCWSIEGWIHSQRRNRLDQKLVEKLVRAHTNLVLRESLDDALRHL